MKLTLKTPTGFLFFAALILLISCKKTTDNPGQNRYLPVVNTDTVYYNHAINAMCAGSVHDTGSGKILRYGFCWGTAPHPEVDNPNAVTVDSYSGSSSHFFATLGPIVPVNIYYVRAFASNKDGYGYGNEIKFIPGNYPVVPPDGFYVTGTSTAFSGPDTRALMKVTPNEVGGTLRPSLLELYIPVRAGTGGFSIVQVNGNVQRTFGPGPDFGTVVKPAADEPKVPFQRGHVSSTSSAKFTVPADGMYHVVIDYELNEAAIVPVHWEMTGSATPSGWAADTELAESAFGPESMTWTATNLLLITGEWKLRYSHGWKVEIDTADSDPFKWVKVNTNLGGVSGALVPGGANLINSVPGIYTVTMAYTLGSGYTATLTRTGNIPPIDYSDYQMGIIGDAYTNPDGTPGDWTQDWGKSLPVKAGTSYTWTYTIDFISGKDFKFRQGDDWSGKVIGFYDVTMAGPAAANFSDDGGIFQVTVGGNYTIVLNIEASTETYTVTATKN